MKKKHRVRDASLVSYTMSKIRSSGSSMERVMERALKRVGLRPRIQSKVTGRPDFSFPRLKVAIFCDSHFWHGYRWAERKRDLRRNREFWLVKIQRNIERDREVNRLLRHQGWKVFRFWEHQIERSADKCAAKVKAYILARRASRQWQ